MRITALDHIALPVRDLEASLRFYRDALGLEVVNLEAFQRGQAPYPSLRLGPEVFLDLVPGRAANGLDHLALVVEPTELTAVARRLREQGYTVESDLRRRYGARGSAVSIVAHDPDGHRVELRYY